MKGPSLLLLVSLVACQKYEPPDQGPAPSASVAPVKPAAEPPPPPPPPPPKPKPLPDVPPVDLACTKHGDCGPAFFDDACCAVCEPRVGSKTWTKALDAFCKAHPNAECKAPGPCGFVFGAPKCVDGKCVTR